MKQHSYPAPSQRHTLPTTPDPTQTEFGLKRYSPLLRFAACLAFAFSVCVHAQIALEGVTDKQVVADQAQFRVLDAAEYDYACTLNGTAFAPGTWVKVNQPDFYEIQVMRHLKSGGATESLVRRFIVRSSERADTEWGLPPWTPFPVVNASPDEVAGAMLRIVTPAVWLEGRDLPVACFLETTNGEPWRSHLLVKTPSGKTSVQLRRGFGAGWVPSSELEGAGLVRLEAAGVGSERTVRVESSPSWITAGGTITGSVTWSPNSFYWVTNTLVVPAGAQLTIGSGTLVALGAKADVKVSGTLRIEGSPSTPVTWAAKDPTASWGGFQILGAAAKLEASNALFIGAGANPVWFDENPGYEVHKRQQALFLVDGGTVTLDHCSAWDMEAQFGHGKNGTLTLRHCLAQRFVTGGEYNGGSVLVDHSAMIEFPRADGHFEDADNDCIYFTTGNHTVRDSVLGWSRDDGIDAGSGGAGSVLASNVWVEATYHEAFAWSGTGRSVTNLACVAINCGQGIEAGWSSGADSPLVFGKNCLCSGNSSGTRFGDNYDWTYNGFLRLTNCFLLYNYRDVFGWNWDDWTYRSNQMDLRGNYLTRPDPLQRTNQTWNPEQDGALLEPFAGPHPDAPPGIGIATWKTRPAMTDLALGVPLALSHVTTKPVTAQLVADMGAGESWRTEIRFEPGQISQRIPVPQPSQDSTFLKLRLEQVMGAVLTGTDTILYVQQAGTATLVSTGEVWKYKDDGANPGANWAAPDFPDAGWKSGHAQFGFGDGDETTPINGGPTSARFAAHYFRRSFELPGSPGDFSQLTVRLLRDDGGIVYLNGVEVFRSNMPTGRVDNLTYTGVNTASETTFYETNLPPALLQRGTNIVAVEIHQANATSSDTSFDFELLAQPGLRLRWERDVITSDVSLWWAEAESVLETSESPAGPWRTVATEADSFPVKIRPELKAFYRLRTGP